MQWKHNMQEVTITWDFGRQHHYNTTNFGTHCAEHALDMRPKSRRAKVWIPTAPPLKTVWFFLVPVNITSLTMPRVR